MNLLEKIRHAELICDALLANIEGRASDVESSYSIADRSISKMSLQELTEQYDWWDKHLSKLSARYESKVSIANGGRGNRTILARFPA